MATKVAPRLIEQGFIRTSNFFNIPVYKGNDTSFADMTFENQVTGKKYQFGLSVKDGSPVLPFTQDEFMAPPPMVSFNRSKHVVISDIDRSEYQVIENFGLKSYDIKMQGILIDCEEHHYPGNLVRKITEMFEAAGTYKAIGTIFSDLNIDEVFFKDGFSIDFVEGYVDTVKFAVNAMSVQPAEFYLK